jgi:hypothetical protein
MHIVYSFIGPIPPYSIDSIEQTRRFYDGPIYYITDENPQHPIVQRLVQEFHVCIIAYEDVISYDFNEIAALCDHKFIKCPDLKGREKLFMRAYERYFLLYRLMFQKSLTNVLFMEVDNLLYDDPRKWEGQLSKKGLAYMYDNESRCGAGIAFLRDTDALLQLNYYFVQDIKNPDPRQGLVHEMRSLHDFWKMNPVMVQMLPTAPYQPDYPSAIYENAPDFPGVLFDVAGMGIYLGGLDPIHTDGVIKKHQRAPWSAVDYRPYHFEWRTDSKERRIPYLLSPAGEWLRINNLHIHSKALRDCM